MMNTTESIAQKALQDLIKTTVLEVLGIIEYDRSHLNRLSWEEREAEVVRDLEVEVQALWVIARRIEEYFGVKDE
jgi:hypothetical protein